MDRQNLIIRAWTVATILTVATLGLAQVTTPTNLPVVSSGDLPLYPGLARVAQIEGDVRLKVTTDGKNVSDVRVESGPPMLAKAAEDNVRSWKFESHVPTSFVAVFSYHLRKDFSCDPDKPRNPDLLLRLPVQVGITANISIRDTYCDPTQGLDLSEPLRVFLTACEVDGSHVPCENMTIRLYSGSLSIEPKRFKESEGKQGFVVPPELRSLKNYSVSVNTEKGTVFFLIRTLPS
jgi:hypothetical protein